MHFLPTVYVHICLSAAYAGSSHHPWLWVHALTAALALTTTADNRRVRAAVTVSLTITGQPAGKVFDVIVDTGKVLSGLSSPS